MSKNSLDLMGTKKSVWIHILCLIGISFVFLISFIGMILLEIDDPDNVDWLQRCLTIFIILWVSKFLISFMIIPTFKWSKHNWYAEKKSPLWTTLKSMIMSVTTPTTKVVGVVTAGGDFYCSDNELTNLNGFPKDVSIGGMCYCHNNRLPLEASLTEKLPENFVGD